MQEIQSPFVHAVGHQQHLDALLAEHFELWAVFGGGQGVSGDVVDGVLTFFHTRFVVGK